MNWAVLGGAGVGLVWGSLLSRVRWALCRRAVNVVCEVVATSILLAELLLVTSRGRVGVVFTAALLVSLLIHRLACP